MQDQEAVTLKAFLAALANQSVPLPAEIQKRLNEIDTNHDRYITDLDELARQNPDLKKPYKTARDLLDSPQERNKGVPPNSEYEKRTSSSELTNIASLKNETDLETLLQKLEKVEDKALVEIVPSVLKSSNPLEFVKNFLSNLSY
jgi:hypothetical protein